MRRSQDGPLRIALIGTRGVPARYGGFETAVEEVGAYADPRPRRARLLAPERADRVPHYRGMNLVHLPALRRRSLETLSHAALSVGHQVTHRHDAARRLQRRERRLPARAARGRVPVATHVDGLEWRRARSGAARAGATTRRPRRSPYMVRRADRRRRGHRRLLRPSSVRRPSRSPTARRSSTGWTPTRSRASGSRRAATTWSSRGSSRRTRRYRRGYRQSGARLPLVVVGSAPYADEYRAAATAPRGRRPRAVPRWCLGPGPARPGVRARAHLPARAQRRRHQPVAAARVGAGAPTVAYDVSFNREVLRDAGHGFATPDDVARLVEDAEADPAERPGAVRRPGGARRTTTGTTSRTVRAAVPPARRR